TDKELTWATGGLIEAGFETSAATLNTLMMMLATNPRVQGEARDELMRVDDPDHLYAWDLRNLPYVPACIKKATHKTILAPGITHFADHDVVYKNHIIPKGAVLVANTAFLYCDPSRFDKSSEFISGRFLNHSL
ncbi:cytochrome P450, partial [Colletotrichum falcatum]